MGRKKKKVVETTIANKHSITLDFAVGSSEDDKKETLLSMISLGLTKGEARIRAGKYTVRIERS